MLRSVEGQLPRGSPALAHAGQQGDPTYWVTPGPACPESCQVVEGPLILDAKGNAKVDLLIHGPTRLGPGQELLQLREITAHDKTTLAALGRAKRQQAETSVALADAMVEANLSLEHKLTTSTTCPTTSDADTSIATPTTVHERAGLNPASHDSPTAQYSTSSAMKRMQFYTASYKTKGKKQRQIESFPELQNEIKEARERMANETCIDQDSKEHADNCAKIADANMGPRLQGKHGSSFLKNVVRVCCFTLA